MRKLALVLLIAGCSEGTIDVPTPADLRLIVSPQSLQTTRRIDPKAVVCSVGLPPSVSKRDVSCRYDASKGAFAADGALFYDSSVARNYTEHDAKEVFRLTLQGYEEGLKTARWEPAPELLAFGDDHHAAYMVSDGRRIGNAFVIRKGRIVLKLVVSGIYYDDPVLVRQMLEPLVQEAVRQD